MAYAENGVHDRRRVDVLLPFLDRLAGYFGLTVHRDDFDIRLVSTDVKSIIAEVKGYTMTDHLAVTGLIDAIDYLDRNRVEGAIVEFGVWRGGSAMAAALRLGSLSHKRALFLFDTFEGMTPPSSEDVRTRDNAPADLIFDDIRCVASIQDVRENLARTEYPQESTFLVRGQVEQTVPDRLPDTIALVRLDTDWYQSTLHELQHTWDRIPSGGVLIIDDYHYW